MRLCPSHFFTGTDGFRAKTMPNLSNAMITLSFDSFAHWLHRDFGLPVQHRAERHRPKGAVDHLEEPTTRPFRVVRSKVFPEVSHYWKWSHYTIVHLLHLLACRFKALLKRPKDDFQNLEPITRGHFTRMTFFSWAQVAVQCLPCPWSSHSPYDESQLCSEPGRNILKNHKLRDAWNQMSHEFSIQPTELTWTIHVFAI